MQKRDSASRQLHSLECEGQAPRVRRPPARKAAETEHGGLLLSRACHELDGRLLQSEQLCGCELEAQMCGGGGGGWAAAAGGGRAARRGASRPCRTCNAVMQLLSEAGDCWQHVQGPARAAGPFSARMPRLSAEDGVRSPAIRRASMWSLRSAPNVHASAAAAALSCLLASPEAASGI